ANEKNGQRWASVPVAVFFDRDFTELYRYIEYPAIYHKERVIGHLRSARPGEAPDEAKSRGGREIGALLESPFFDVWAHGDLVARVQARAESNLFWRHLGVSVVDAKPGWVRLRVPVRDDIKNASGAPVHGGVYSALVDMAVGGALGTLNEASEGGVGQTTLDLNVSYLAGVRDGEI